MASVTVEAGVGAFLFSGPVANIIVVHNWPLVLPQKPAASSWSGGPQGNVVSFTPEVGDAIDRRRGSAVAHVYSGRFTALTLAQLVAFRDFYENGILDGTAVWKWVDPIYNDASNWRFVHSGGTAYSITDITPDRYDLNVNIMRVPG